MSNCEHLAQKAMLQKKATFLIAPFAHVLLASSMLIKIYLKQERKKSKLIKIKIQIVQAKLT